MDEIASFYPHFQLQILSGLLRRLFTGSEYGCNEMMIERET